MDSEQIDLEEISALRSVLAETIRDYKGLEEKYNETLKLIKLQKGLIDKLRREKQEEV